MANLSYSESGAPGRNRTCCLAVRTRGQTISKGWIRIPLSSVQYQVVLPLSPARCLHPLLQSRAEARSESWRKMSGLPDVSALGVAQFKPRLPELNALIQSALNAL